MIIITAYTYICLDFVHPFMFLKSRRDQWNRGSSDSHNSPTIHLHIPPPIQCSNSHPATSSKTLLPQCKRTVNCICGIFNYQHTNGRTFAIYMVFFSLFFCLSISPRIEIYVHTYTYIYTHNSVWRQENVCPNLDKVDESVFGG